VLRNPRLNILILHGVADFARERQTTVRHVRALARYAPGHRFAYQYVNHPVTDSLKLVPWDLVVFDATFLCWRWVQPRSLFERVKADYGWLRSTGAFLAALPQDDFDHSKVLDDWLADYEVDLVCSVYTEHRDILYPRVNARNTPIVPTLAGYIDQDDVTLYQRLRRPFDQRRITVGYRVRRLTTCGRFGILKSEFGRRFAAAAKSKAITDISDDPADTMLAEKWPRFLGDCRFALGSEGGSSVLDPTGAIRDRTLAYMAAHPAADFEEIASACLTTDDEARTFSTISPRVFEVAMAGCCPILIHGCYNNLIAPEEHYIPISPDLSDIEIAVERLRDDDGAKKIAARAAEALLENPALRYSRWVEDLMSLVVQGLNGRKKCGVLSDDEFGRLTEEHQTQARSHELQSHESLMTDYRSEIERLNRSFEEIRLERDAAVAEVHRSQQRLLNRIDRILRRVVTKK